MSHAYMSRAHMSDPDLWAYVHVRMCLVRICRRTVSSRIHCPWIGRISAAEKQVIMTHSKTHMARILN